MVREFHRKYEFPGFVSLASKPFVHILILKSKTKKVKKSECSSLGYIYIFKICLPSFMRWKKYNKTKKNHKNANVLTYWSIYIYFNLWAANMQQMIVISHSEQISDTFRVPKTLKIFLSFFFKCQLFRIEKISKNLEVIWTHILALIMFDFLQYSIFELVGIK